MRTEEFSTLMRELVRPRPVAEVLAMFEAEDVSTSEHAVALLVTYMQGPRPLLELSRERWVELFRRVGFIDSGVVGEGRRPRRRLTLFRGAVAEYSHGLSWTSRWAFADAFRRENAGLYGQWDCRVWSCEVDPSWLLARGQHWGGGEWVVDVPADAEVVLCETAPAGR